MPVQPMTSGRPTLRNNRPLAQEDPEIAALIEEERQRQIQGIELIASENFTSGAVLECLGSCLTNKYSEGQAGARYYGGNDVIDKIENVCKDRMLKAFNLNAEEWGVNVQPYSGSPANFAVYTALLDPHARIMGLDLPSGGHLTHGFYTLNKKEKTRKAISATSIFFESLPYRVSEKDGIIDYDNLEQLAGLFKPAMIICGSSAYPQDFDYARFRKIADDNGALLMMDMAHISGLVASRDVTGLANPFDYCDIVTTTTHKSLRGPRAGMIFFKNDDRNFGARINQAVFPALQGGPHEHQIAGVATQLKEVMTPEFKEYSVQVIKNAQALAGYMKDKGYKLATGGTVNHLVLVDLRPMGITGSKMELACDVANITLNKNAVLGDRSALSPGGIRVGAPALTTRGMNEDDFREIAEFLHRCAQICLKIQEAKGKMLKDFKEGLGENADLMALRADVNAFATRFPMPGFETKNLKVEH